MSELVGSLHLWPGAPMPSNLQSTRRDWAGRLAPGLRPSALPGMLAGVFNLCGHAHRAASTLALQALGVQGLQPAGPLAGLLRRETVLEHVRRIALDWPRLLAPPALFPALAGAAPAALRSCPWMQGTAPPDEDAAAMRHWLQQHWLLQDAATWVQAWEEQGEAWLQAWAQRHAAQGWLPQALLAAQAWSQPLALQHTAALPVPQGSAGWRALADVLTRDPGLALCPLWQGRPAHTGTWTRQAASGSAAPASSWGLLGSRLADLARLLLPDAEGQAGCGLLRWGAFANGPQRALAWVEMARGLLVHQLSLLAAGQGQALVLGCQVLAPTDWNFHPQGIAAQALAQLPAWSAREATSGLMSAHAAMPAQPEAPPAVRLLIAALDPCVPFRCAPLPLPAGPVPPAGAEGAARA